MGMKDCFSPPPARGMLGKVWVTELGDENGRV